MIEPYVYVPREQFVEFHNRTQRWAAMPVHRRAGKTYACVNDLAIRALYTTKKNARYGYIAPYRSQAKEIAWTYLKMVTEGYRDGAPREAELRVRLHNGAWATLYGADNPDALRGLYFDGLVLDEYDDMKPSLMGEVILPTLVDRRGWMVVIGTFKGRGAFYKLCKMAESNPDWYFKRMRASESGILADEDLQQLKAQMSPEEYDQEMELNVDAALKGTYYTALINDLEAKGRIVCGKLYDPGQKVHVAADIGFSDSCAWWFWQPRPDGFALVDYHSADGMKLEYYLRMLKDKGYEYEEIWLPHDARAKSLQTGRSTIEQLMQPWLVAPDYYAEGERLPLRITPRLAVQHGIEAARMILPACWFDLETCAEGLDALRAYHRKWNDTAGVFENKPKHDHSSNGADAFRYFAMVARGSRGQSAESLAKERRSKWDHKPIQGLLKYENGRIVTVQTLDEMAPLKPPLKLARARRI